MDGLDGHRHAPVRIRRLKGKDPSDHLFCEVCGVKWPCLEASQAVLDRMRERGRIVPPGKPSGGLPSPVVL